MEKIARTRSLCYYLYSRTQGCRKRSFGGTVSFCSQANGDDDASQEDKHRKLINALKGLKIVKKIGQKMEKKTTSMNFQALDVRSANKPVVLEALKGAVASLPEREKAEEELITELIKQDAQTLAAQQTSQRPDRLQENYQHSTESDLIQRLRSTHQPDKKSNNLSLLMSELRVQQQPKGVERENINVKTKNDSHFKRVFINHLEGEGADMEHFQTSSQTEPYKRQRKRSLFERYRLNIFETSVNDEQGLVKVDTKASIWDLEEQATLKRLRYDSISNGFDEMSKLTEEGRLWQYPINNEQGMESENNVGFHEHIFLETHLDSFPTKGPIRHFMELVTQGLSMNPYITVQQKKDNIQWFKNYFKNKESTLKETGAIEQEFSF